MEVCQIHFGMIVVNLDRRQPLACHGDHRDGFHSFTVEGDFTVGGVGIDRQTTVTVLVRTGSDDDQNAIGRIGQRVKVLGPHGILVSSLCQLVVGVAGLGDV